MNPSFPVYIISKGRHDTRLTSKALEAISVPYHIVVEPQEYADYASVITAEKILTLPFSNLGQGSIPARNWVWDHALSCGHKRHWILDDNIAWFAYMSHNKKTRMADGTCFKVVEDLSEKYENVGLSGLQYEMFIPARDKTPPVSINTRIYSCILVLNSLPFRWRGRYNEDTDLSLRVLKAGLCTILVNAFVCKKMATMTMRGGNTTELYRTDLDYDGRLEMAKSLQKQHPDVVKIKRRWGRWQHVVDYRRFAANRLIPKPGIADDAIRTDYGLAIVDAIPTVVDRPCQEQSSPAAASSLLRQHA